MLMCWSFAKLSSFILAAGVILRCNLNVCLITRNIFFFVSEFDQYFMGGRISCFSHASSHWSILI